MRCTPTRAVASWITYDFANTIYSMNVVTMYFPLWMTVNLGVEDMWVSIGNSVSMALVGLSMPVLGVVSDRYRARMPYLTALTLLCVIATALIGLVGNLGLGVLLTATGALLCYVLANFAYQGALVFYNALLPEVSTPATMGKISGYGVAVGYLGSFFGLLMVMPFVTGGIDFLGVEVPFFRGKEVEVARLEPSACSYFDLQVDRDSHYAYRLAALDSGGHAWQPEWKIATRDTSLSGSGPTRRGVVVHWRAPRDARIAGLLLFRRPRGWGHVGSFVPTAFLFLLTALPTFVFVRDRNPVAGRKWTLARASLSAALPAVAYLPFLALMPCAVLGPVAWRLACRKEHAGVGNRVRAYHRFVVQRLLSPLFPGVAQFDQAARQIVQGLTRSRQAPGVLRFLAAKFFYEEAVETIIIFMAVYAVKVVGFATEVVVPFFLVATTAAAIGSFLFGLLTDRVGPKAALTWVLNGWILCLGLVVLFNSQPVFWVLACFIGMFLGGTWTAARPLLVTLVPPERLGEFFGLYSLSGKAAAITGPLLWGAVVYVLGGYGDVVRYKAAVFTLAGLMVVGRVLLHGVPDRWANKASLSQG
ncbi:MAG: MFS transporter [candidate division KSB1 bacterium]|nr:MFS transporter [candidate division KSB1 bacterium]